MQRPYASLTGWARRYALLSSILCAALLAACSSSPKGGKGTFVEKVNDVSFKMVLVEGATFQMGCTEGWEDCGEDEHPAHPVTLTDYYISETEVTQALWKAVMGSNPARFNECPTCPVETVSWEDAQAFARRLSSLTGKTYTLPTEAQWEFAARGGKDGRNTHYPGSDEVNAIAWYTDNTNDVSTKPVATKAPNELGLYDMGGNVYEWCYDYQGSYVNAEQTDPRGPRSGSVHVFRGGCWFNSDHQCTVYQRFLVDPSGWVDGLIGFRLVMKP